VDVDSFVRDGFVAVRRAVNAGTVAACRDVIWTAMEQRGIRQGDCGTWCPLVEAGSLGLSDEPFAAAYMAPALTAAYDPSWLKLVHTVPGGVDGVEGLAEVVGQGVGSGDRLPPGLDLDGAVAAGGLDEFPD